MSLYLCLQPPLGTLIGYWFNLVEKDLYPWPFTHCYGNLSPLSIIAAVIACHLRLDLQVIPELLTPQKTMHIDWTSVHKSSWSLMTDTSVTTQKDTKSSPISCQTPATLICRFSGENEHVLPCKTNLLGYNHMAQMVASLQLPVAVIQHCTLRAFPIIRNPESKHPQPC